MGHAVVAPTEMLWGCYLYRGHPEGKGYDHSTRIHSLFWKLAGAVGFALYMVYLTVVSYLNSVAISYSIYVFV